MEVMRFYGEVAMASVEEMLQGMVKHKAERLPHLKEIVFYEAAHTASDAAAEMAKKLQELCAGVGIRLVLGS